MANSIRIAPRGDNCSQCLSLINYNKSVQNFDNTVVSRVQARSHDQITPNKPLNYAILRLHQEAVWMKLALYQQIPSRKALKGHSPRSTSAVDILIDTGAALSLIKEDIVANWKEVYPKNISLQETSQKAETCSGSQFQITHKSTVYNCNLGSMGEVVPFPIFFSI